jgi:hypothetical protein
MLISWVLRTLFYQLYMLSKLRMAGCYEWWIGKTVEQSSAGLRFYYVTSLTGLATARKSNMRTGMWTVIPAGRDSVS